MVVNASTKLILATLGMFTLGAAAAPQPGMLIGKGGVILGSVKATAAPHGVLLRIEATKLTPGWHAVHIHEKGACTDADFKAAGGHVHQMQASVHGLLNPAATDSGDLPNIHVGDDGKLDVELYTSLVSLKGSPAGVPLLLDADGSALVIHANADDYLSQPIGGAGARIACAIIG